MCAEVCADGCTDVRTRRGSLVRWQSGTCDVTLMEDWKKTGICIGTWMRTLMQELETAMKHIDAGFGTLKDALEHRYVCIGAQILELKRWRVGTSDARVGR